MEHEIDGNKNKKMKPVSEVPTNSLIEMINNREKKNCKVELLLMLERRNGVEDGN